MLIIAALQKDTDYIKEWLNNWSVILNVGSVNRFHMDITQDLTVGTVLQKMMRVLEKTDQRY
jgi:hypothetical protein